jgi:predicted nucleic acid-binding protein
MILLDTSFLIDFFRGVEATSSFVEDNVAVTVITYHEIMTGVKRKRATKETEFFRRFFAQVRILTYDQKAAEESSSIAAQLMSVGITVNALDILIAAIALTNGISRIATADKDFLEIEKVTDLKVVVY